MKKKGEETRETYQWVHKHERLKAPKRENV